VQSNLHLFLLFVVLSSFAEKASDDEKCWVLCAELDFT